MGNSQSQQLEDTKNKLVAAEQRNAALNAEKSKLTDQLQMMSQTMDLQQKALAETVDNSRQQLQEREDQLSQALKQKQIAEGLRRSDALLAKRLLHAQLQHIGGEGTDNFVRGVDDSAKAAAMALSAHSELELREMLVLQTSEVESLKQRASEMERASIAQRRSELTRELWVPPSPHDSYTSVTLRSARGHSLGGLRLKPFSPMLGFIYQSAELDQPQWGAVGGSLLMQQSVQEWALRAGICAQPAPDQQVAVSFDRNIMSDRHAGLSYSFKTRRDSLTARLFGTLDLQGGSQHRHGLEVVYDM